jgi:hypothetical protein
MICLGLILAGVVIALGGVDSFANINFNERYTFFVWDDLLENRSNNDLTVNRERVAGNSFSTDYQITAEITKLDIEAGVGSFQVLPWDNDYIRLEIQGRGNCKYYREGNSFKVEGFDADDSWWQRASNSWRSEDNELTLYVPANHAFTDIEIDLGVGTLEIRDLVTDSLSGDVGVGKLIMRNMATRRLDLETGVGDVSFEGAVSGDVEAECGVGSITLLVKGNENDFDYLIDCSVGTVTVGNRAYSGLNNTNTVNNNSHKSMRLECSVGSIVVRFFE